MRKSIILSLALSFLVGFYAYAAPARIVARQYFQPDGTTVTLRLVGDEFSHYFLTDDNQIVVSKNDVFYFAEPGANGYPKASDVLACNPNDRSAEAVSFLSNINKEVMLKASTSQRVSRAKKMSSSVPREASGESSSANWPSGIGLFPDVTFPRFGSPDALIILVQFPDQKFTMPNAKQYFTDLASKEGFSDNGIIAGQNPGAYAYGSISDYYKACSNGKFTPKFHVLGPVTMSKNMAYYGANDENGGDLNPDVMVEEAVQLLDPTTDFSIFDNDNDGYVDNIYIIYSGLGETSGGSENTIWPHAAAVVSENKYDGKYIYSYGCSSELYYQDNSLIMAEGIGTFCHEFAHVLGLPDLYAYGDDVIIHTPGPYSIMDIGSNWTFGRMPPTFSIYERNAMGWADIEVLNEGVGKKVKLENILASNKGYAIRADNDNEFFLLENRQQSGWDECLPGHGLLIWHINYDLLRWNTNSVNAFPQQYVDIVEAGGVSDSRYDAILAQYPFPGSKNVTSFTSSTTPALKSWSDRAIDVPITNIKENADGIITFDVGDGIERPVPPICNYTDSVVISETPITVTLSRPSSSSDSAKIHYKWTYDDESDKGEGIYTEPITFVRSAHLSYWLEDNSLKSDIKYLRISIIKRPILSGENTIIYRDSEDGMYDLNATTYLNEVEEGVEIAAFGSCSKVYSGNKGLKFGSSKADGILTLNLNDGYQSAYMELRIKAAAWVSSKDVPDDASISVNGLKPQSISKDFAEYTFELSDSVISSITISSTKRMYVKSITFVSDIKSHVESISLSATEWSGEVGDSVTLTATVLPENATDKTVNWKSSNDKVATVNANGKVTAVAIGEATITATSGDVSATCKVTVVATPVESITISATEWSGEVGDTVTLTAKVLPKNATNKTVNWKSSNDKVATVDANGKVTAVTIGEAIITATVAEGSATIIDSFESYESFGVDKAGDWRFYDGDKSAIYIIQGVEVPNLPYTGSYIILDGSYEGLNSSFAAHTGNKTLACFAAQSGVNDDWAISPILNGKAQTVSFYAKTYTTQYGNEAFDFYYSTTGSEPKDFIKLGGNKNVPAEWTKYSFDLPEGAKYFAIRCISEDQFIFMVDDVNYQSFASEHTASCNINVVATPVESITISATEWSGKVGETVTLTATVLPESSTDKTITWKSNNDAVATVDANGKVTAVALGEAVITATSGSASATCKVTVVPTLVESITVEPTSWSGLVEEQKQLTVTVLPEDATDKSVEWASSDATVATVDNTGLVKLLAEGNCTIIVSTTDGSNLKAECIITSQSGIDDIFADDNATYDVYNLKGILLHKACDKATLKQLVPGFYVIRTGSESKTVLIQ